MKICVIGSRGINYQYSGIENAMKELLPRIESRSEIKFVVYGYDLDDRNEKTENIRHILIPKLVWENGGNALASFYAFVHSFIFERPNGYLFFASGPSVFSIVTALFRIPTISAIRAIDSQREKWNWFQKNILRLGEYIAFKFALATTVNSLQMKEYFSKFSPIYIPNGYSTCEIGSDKMLVEYDLEKNQYLLFAGRLVPEKRPDILIKAFEKFKMEHHSKLKLVIAGGQESSKHYLNFLENLASDDVLFLGHLSKKQLNPLMRNSLLFVHPSILEGMSNSLLSAMSEKVCCLCTDIPENRAIILYEEAFFKKDDWVELSEKIGYYVNNEVSRLSLAKGLNKHIKDNFSWDESSESYKNLILSIM